MPIKEKLANRNSRPLTAEMYENYPGFRAGSSLRYSPKSLPRWLAKCARKDTRSKKNAHLHACCSTTLEIHSNITLILFVIPGRYSYFLHVISCPYFPSQELFENICKVTSATTVNTGDPHQTIHDTFSNIMKRDINLYNIFECNLYKKLNISYETVRFGLKLYLMNIKKEREALFSSQHDVTGLWTAHRFSLWIFCPCR